MEDRGGSDIVSVINIDDTDSPYAPASSNILILADTTNGNISIDIANAVGLTDGYTFYVKKTNANNTITFTANVDGGTKTLYSTMMVKLYYTNSLFTQYHEEIPPPLIPSLSCTNKRYMV